MIEPKSLIDELRGFAEGSTSARASLMRDAADMLDLLQRDRDHWEEQFRLLLKAVDESDARWEIPGGIYEFTGARMPSPVQRARIRERSVERIRRSTPDPVPYAGPPA